MTLASSIGRSGSAIGKVKCIDDYNKGVLGKGKAYDPIETEQTSFGKSYRVYSLAFNDDGVFPKSEFVLIDTETAIEA